MKIICAFDSFKGCMTAKEVCNAAVSGLRKRYPDAEIVCLPMSDGGEGMVECIAEAADAKMVSVKVHDPLMQTIETHYVLLDTIHFDEQIKDADFILTGEGKSDKQTLMGKVPKGILKRAMKQPYYPEVKEELKKTYMHWKKLRSPVLDKIQFKNYDFSQKQQRGGRTIELNTCSYLI